MEPGSAVVIPVKDFTKAKERLTEVLGDEERARLAEQMATKVVEACAPLEVLVVCDSEIVRSWAERVGARVLWTPGLGLIGAVEAGVTDLASRGVSTAVIAHSDLPLATDLAWLTDFNGVTIVPDRHLDGTNVICIPTDAGFGFAYGPDSFTRHRQEAVKLGLVHRVIIDDALSWDVDRPEDLERVLAEELAKGPGD